MILEVQGTLRVYTPFGPGLVKFLRQNGDEADMTYHVWLESGVIVDVPTRECRAQRNWTQGRRAVVKPEIRPIEELTGAQKSPKVRKSPALRG